MPGAEIEANFVVDPNGFEAHRFVQRHAGIVGQRNAGKSLEVGQGVNCKQRG
jgi:hypothetical protein